MANYSFDTFLSPVTAQDRMLQIKDILGDIKWSISPFSVTITYVSSNLVKIKAIDEMITLDFSSPSEALMALKYLQSQIQTLKNLTPFNIDRGIKEYVSASLLGATGPTGPPSSYLGYSNDYISLPGTIGSLFPINITPGLAITPNENIIISSYDPYTDENYQYDTTYFEGTVDTYDAITGSCSVYVTYVDGVVGSTYSFWGINLTGRVGPQGPTGSVGLTGATGADGVSPVISLTTNQIAFGDINSTMTSSSNLTYDGFSFSIHSGFLTLDNSQKINFNGSDQNWFINRDIGSGSIVYNNALIIDIAGSSNEGYILQSTSDYIIHEIRGSDGMEIHRVKNGSNQFISYQISNDGSTIFYVNDGSSNSEAISWNSYGYVGIGNTTPSYLLEINGVGTSTGYGYIQSTVTSDSSESGISLNNIGAGGSIWNLISTNNASGIGPGMFSIGNAVTHQNLFNLDATGIATIFPNNGNSRLTIDNNTGVLDFYSNDSYFNLNGNTRLFQIGDWTNDWYNTKIILNDDAGSKSITYNAAGSHNFTGGVFNVNSNGGTNLNDADGSQLVFGNNSNFIISSNNELDLYSSNSSSLNLNSAANIVSNSTTGTSFTDADGSYISFGNSSLMQFYSNEAIQILSSSGTTISDADGSYIVFGDSSNMSLITPFVFGVGSGNGIVLGDADRSSITFGGGNNMILTTPLTLQFISTSTTVNGTSAFTGTVTSPTSITVINGIVTDVH